jgi:hypothetical protein
MADLSSILAQGNALAAQQVNAVPPPAPEKSNLRAGLLEYHAKINNALALGAENLGMGGAQQRLLNQADAGMREAQQVAPERQNTVMGDMKSPMDAYRSGQLGNYIGDTLHNLPGDIVRGAPAMAAPLVAGMVGTALSGGNPLVGGMAGAATMMPQTVGDIAERQYANPDNKDSAGLRALKATGYGAASAVAQNIVPQWMGGKLVGKTAVQGVERAAGNVVGRTTEEVVQNTLANKTLASVAAKPVAPSLATNVAKNLAESVGGNAVAGAGAELANQLGANEQIDTGKMGTAAVEGGVMGSAFAPLGIAGEMRGGRSSAESAAIAASRAQRGLAPDGTPLPAGGPPEGPGGAPGGATTPAGRKAAREAPAAAPVEPTVGSAAPIQEAMDKAKAGKTVADKLAAGEPLMDNVSDFVSAVGDKATQMYDKGKATASEWVKKAAQEYVKRRDLTPEQRATAEAAAANPSDDANHQAMGLLFNELSQKDHDATVLDQLDKDFPEKKGDKGSKQSASTAAADKRIASITEQ